MEGELLGRKGWGQGAKPTHPWPLKSGEGGLLGPAWPPLLFPRFVDFQGHPAWPVPLLGWGLGRGDGGAGGRGHKGFTFSTKQ